MAGGCQAMTWQSELRMRQARLCANLISKVAKRSSGRRLVEVLRRSPWLVQALVAERRPFPDLAAAALAVKGHDRGGHSNAYNVTLHAQLSQNPRPSDYAAFFHLVTRSHSIHRIFDYGGNVGNLFYYYSRYLAFAEPTTWIVHDLPEVVAEGRKMAAARGEHRLEFATDRASADGADLFIASGSLHYMDEPLATTLSRLQVKPRYILINRTPLTDGKTVATVQDGREFMAPCMLLNKQELIDSLTALGYRLVDRWDATELSLRLPFHPENSAPYYSGLFLEQPSPATT